jgi:hypothetical protein
VANQTLGDAARNIEEDVARVEARETLPNEWWDKGNMLSRSQNQKTAKGTLTGPRRTLTCKGKEKCDRRRRKPFLSFPRNERRKKRGIKMKKDEKET